MSETSLSSAQSGDAQSGYVEVCTLSRSEGCQYLCRHPMVTVAVRHDEPEDDLGGAQIHRVLHNPSITPQTTRAGPGTALFQ